MNFENKTVLVYGTGISGISAVSLLESVQARVILYDENTKITKEQVKAKLAADTKARIILGALSEDIIKTLDMVVLSPGVPTDIPVVEGFKKRGIPVWGEIELAYRLSKGRVVAITGTNGKTTTTTLLKKIAYDNGIWWGRRLLLDNVLGILCTSHIPEHSGYNR